MMRLQKGDGVRLAVMLAIGLMLLAMLFSDSAWKTGYRVPEVPARTSGR